MTRVAKQDVDPGQGATRFSELFASMVNHEMRNALTWSRPPRACSNARGTENRDACSASRSARGYGAHALAARRLHAYRAGRHLVLIREPFELGGWRKL